MKHLWRYQIGWPELQHRVQLPGTRKHRKITSVLLAVVLITSLGASGCDKGQISDALFDIGLSIDTAVPFLPANLKGKAAQLKALTVSAKTFVDNSDFTSAASVLNQSAILFEEIANGLTALTPEQIDKVKRYLALGNIALHLVIRLVKKQIPPSSAPQADAFSAQTPWSRDLIPAEVMALSKTKGKL